MQFLGVDIKEFLSATGIFIGGIIILGTAFFNVLKIFQPFRIWLDRKRDEKELTKKTLEEIPKIFEEIKKIHEKLEPIESGTLVNTRAILMRNCDKLLERDPKVMTIDESDCVRAQFEAYKALGGNSKAEILYNMVNDQLKTVSCIDETCER